ncbi:MAG: hypothetical protein WKF71_05610 [Pyrinomonadaceae bacterium]
MIKQKAESQIAQIDQQRQMKDEGTADKIQRKLPRLNRKSIQYQMLRSRSKESPINTKRQKNLR